MIWWDDAARNGLKEVYLYDEQQAAARLLEYDNVRFFDFQNEEEIVTEIISKDYETVAKYFGKNELRDITKEDVWKNAADIREKLGDRAFLRAMHFFDENDRVDREAAALKAGDHTSTSTTVISATAMTT